MFEELYYTLFFFQLDKLDLRWNSAEYQININCSVLDFTVPFYEVMPVVFPGQSLRNYDPSIVIHWKTWKHDVGSTLIISQSHSPTCSHPLWWCWTVTRCSLSMRAHDCMDTNITVKAKLSKHMHAHMLSTSVFFLMCLAVSTSAAEI